MKPSVTDMEFVAHSMLICTNFHNLLKDHLLEKHEISPEQVAFELYNASFPVVSHNAEADPVFNYANLCAQDIWQMNWEKFTNTPSRFSAEPMEREEREQHLELTARQGYIDGFSGTRITADNKRFFVKDFILWNLLDLKGNYKGQAANFHQWEFL